MPRDPSGVYTKPFPNVLPDTTVESTVYNGFVGDVETDLNAARPVIAGGTGATNATQARANLQAEVSTAIVTNYDSQIWEPGSFYSAATATSPPVAGHRFAGIVYGPDANNMVIEARDLDDASVPGIVYVREKNAGVWAPTWSAGTFVLKTGDTMTGNLTIQKSAPRLLLDRADTPGGQVVGLKGSINRWTIIPGNGNAESGSNAGSDFVIERYTDAGGFIDNPLSITRATGNVALTQNLSVGTSISAGANISAGASITATLDVSASRNISAVGTATFGSGSSYIAANPGGNPAFLTRGSDSLMGIGVLNLAGNGWGFQAYGNGSVIAGTTLSVGTVLTVNSSAAATAPNTGAIQTPGGISAFQNCYFANALTVDQVTMGTTAGLNYHWYRNGGGWLQCDGSQVDASGYLFLVPTSSGNFWFQVLNNGKLRVNNYAAGTMSVDGGGNIVTSSDERMKNVLAPFTRSLDALRKIGGADIFSFKHEAETLPDQRYAGFLAQKVQRAIPEAVNAGPDGMLAIDDRPLIATLMNAVLELADRIDQLTGDASWRTKSAR